MSCLFSLSLLGSLWVLQLPLVVQKHACKVMWELWIHPRCVCVCVSDFTRHQDEVSRMLRDAELRIKGVLETDG